MLTNEEKRVSAYASTERPTVPSEVAPDTPLETLNLNWREEELRERERTKHVHRLHPYLGKFIPQIVEVFLRKYFVSGQTVADPFCGSGTTLVQSNEIGVNAVGYDISAFNVLLCRVKTTRYDHEALEGEVKDVLRRTDEALAASALYETDNEYLLAWFAPRALRELLTYRHFIETGNYAYPDVLRIILSRSARSARLTRHFDLDFPKEPQTEPYWCYKHRRTCRPTTEAYKFLERYSLDTLRRIEEFAALRKDATVHVYHADSREATFPAIDGVITSPPYVGLIDYHEQHAYAYHLLGLKDRSEDEIGPATRGASAQAREQYKSDIVEALRRALEAMPAGGPLIVVAADKRDLYEDIAERLGVQVEGVVQRHVNRRTGMRANEFYESIFAWRKP